MFLSEAKHQNRRLRFSLNELDYSNVFIERRTDGQRERETNIHTFLHAYIHTYIPTLTHTYIHTYIHTYARTYVYTYIQTYIQTCYMHACMHAYIHTYVRTNRRKDKFCQISLNSFFLFFFTQFHFHSNL
jgi:hypothetical protein